MKLKRCPVGVSANLLKCSGSCRVSFALSCLGNQLRAAAIAVAAAHVGSALNWSTKNAAETRRGYRRISMSKTQAPIIPAM
jgi:hypothetical protein